MIHVHASIANQKREKSLFRHHYTTEEHSYNQGEPQKINKLFNIVLVLNNSR